MAVSGRIDTDEVVCKSTEEMMAEIERVNAIEDKEDLVIWSTDVSAMYPSLDIPVVAKVVVEEFLSTDLEIELDTEELSLYLAVIKTSNTTGDQTDVCSCTRNLILVVMESHMYSFNGKIYKQ